MHSVDFGIFSEREAAAVNPKNITRAIIKLLKIQLRPHIECTIKYFKQPVYNLCIS